MKGGTARGSSRPSGARPGLTMVPPASPPPASSPASTGSNPSPASARNTPAAQPIASLESGIVVREEELGSVKAQRLYKMRCECGRSWFELELPTLVECPACKKLCLVSA